MSSTIDTQVVQMKFDNAAFQRGVADTLKSLDSLNKALKLEGATKGIDELSNATHKVDLNRVGTALDTIADKFKAVSVIGITALTNIANRAVNAGLTLVKSLSVQPVMEGLREYETNLNSIQTILANTGLEGAAGLAKVNKALDELNHYSDQTIYNFSEMARNIGTFTAAGVSLEVATAAIKGIANLAAISGSNSQQASAAMYQLSQAISAGKVSLEDWNSVVNAGLGGKVFQNALMETARVHGVAIDKMVKDAGSFRLTLQEGWLTGEILTETLSKFTGDLNAAQLKTMGYNDQQIAGILKMGKTAQEAATKVKTFSQLINTLQEAATSGWAKTWQLIFGDFEEARTLFTNVNDVLGGFINAMSDARNKVLGDWKELGGRTVIIEAIANAFDALIRVVKPIGQAFRDIFPATTGKQLYDLSVSIRNFTENLKIGGKTAENLRRTFAGVFAVLGIGWDIVKQIAKTFFNLFGIVFEGGGSFLEITAKIGDFLVAIRKAIQEGNGLTKFFQNVEKVLAVPIRLIQLLIGYIGKLFDKFDGADAANAVTGFVGKFDPLGRLADAIINSWSKVPGIISEIVGKILPIASKVGTFFANIGTQIADFVKDINFDTVFKGIAAGGLGAFLVSLTGLILKLRQGVPDGGGLFDSITDSIDKLTDTLQTMQNTLRAATLLEIALAIGILTLSVTQLSKVDQAGLTRSLTAISVMFAQLIGAMVLFEKVVDAGDIAKIALIGVGLILLATAIDVLAVAVIKLAELDWNGLAKGLTGVTVLLAALVGALKFMPPSQGLISTGAGLIVLAGAIKLLVSSVTDLSGLGWEEMARGLTGVAALLTALTLFTMFSKANAVGLLSGAGIILLATGIKILASAVEDFAELSWGEIGRGLTAMAGGLALVGAALYLIPPTSVFSAAAVLGVAFSLGMIADALKDLATMSWMEIARGMTALAGALTLITAALLLIPPTSLLSAAAVLVVAASLGMIADALKDMAGFSWGEIGKSLTLLAGSLTIIAVAMAAMIIALPGAAALLVVAASLAILAPILALFGNMSLSEIGKSLLMLAGVFAVLGVSGVLLAPLVPVLLGLGVAVTLLGVGMLAAGAGVLLFATGLTALSISGAAATVALVTMVSALASLLPMVATQLGLAIIAFANTISTAGPAFVKAITTVLLSIMQAIDTVGPKIVETLYKLLTKLLETMLKYAPKLTDMGMKLIIAILTGVANNIGKVVDAATTVVVNFINAMARNQPRVIQAGVDFIISFVNGLANAIRNNSQRMGEAGANLGTAIIEGMARGLLGGSGKIASIAKDVARKALDAAKNFLGIKSPSKAFEEVGEESDKGFAKGLVGFAKIVERSAENVGKGALDRLGAAMSNLPDAISGDIDMTPVIRPVLDLTDVKKGTNQIDAYFKNTPMSLKATYSNASGAALGVQGNQEAAAEADRTTNAGGVTYNQYNTSPKALSTADIYRQTKNQLSTAKGALPK